MLRISRQHIQHWYTLMTNHITLHYTVYWSMTYAVMKCNNIHSLANTLHNVYLSSVSLSKTYLIKFQLKFKHFHALENWRLSSLDHLFRALMGNHGIWVFRLTVTRSQDISSRPFTIWRNHLIIQTVAVGRTGHINKMFTSFGVHRNRFSGRVFNSIIYARRWWTDTWYCVGTFT